MGGFCLKHLQRIICYLSSLILLGTLLIPGAAAADLGISLQRTTAALLDLYPQAAYGDEWTVFALCTAGAPLPEGYVSGYTQSVQDTLRQTGGVLSSTKATDYAKAVLALTAAGYNASSFGGYDLTAPLKDLSFARKQGINGIIYSLLALDYAKASFDRRDEYVSAILELQLSDGGWALTGSNGDADMTAMAMQALSRYLARSSVRKAVQAGLAFLQAKQNPDGGFSSYGAANPESAAQVLLALG